MSEDKKKIVVLVEGGVVQAVHSDIGTDELDVNVIDADNLRAEGFGKDQIDRIIEEAILDLPYSDYR